MCLRLHKRSVKSHLMPSDYLGYCTVAVKLRLSVGGGTEVVVSLSCTSQVLICCSLRAIGILVGHPYEAAKKSRSIISRLNVLQLPWKIFPDLR